jgi:RNA polymerase sigma-70 factor (ECF subfamily)
MPPTRPADASGAPPGDARFTATRWSLVLAARRPDDGDAAPALAWLCERYWFPLFAYARGRGRSPAEAEDLVQSFFEKVVGGEMLRGADAERGRFRSFLLGCFNHFLAHQHRDGQRLKRGGGAECILLDHEEAESRLQRELADRRTPALDFDRVWALTLLDRVIEQLRGECDDDGKDGRFAELQTFIQGERGEVSLGDAASRLGLSLPAVKSIVHRLRQRFRELVRAEIRETVASDEAVPGELQHLFAALGR